MNLVLRFGISLSILLSTSLNAVSQTLPIASYFTKITSPSPEADRFIRYGNYGVENRTGKPNIGIPLYEIKTSSFQIPVTLNYESTGCTVDDLASWVGSGWLLNTGGAITRVVVGKADEGNGGFLQQTHYTYAQLTSTNQANVDYLKTVADNFNETEPDIYYYNFNGHSGQFTYDQNNNIFQTPLTPLKISRVGMGFQIIDEAGNIYSFNAAETSEAETDLVSTLDNSTTTWWLTKIQNTEKTDEITFEYQADAAEYENKTNYGASYGPNCNSVDDPWGQNNCWQYSSVSTIGFSNSVTHREWTPMRLTQINHNNGKIVFNRVNDRLDGGSSRLDNIEIYRYAAGAFTTMRTYKFITSYFQYTGPVEVGAPYYSSTNGKYRLKLNRLETYDAGGTLIEKHGFDYETNTMPTYRGSLAQDYWGFCNGADGNNSLHTLLPAQTTLDLRYNFGGANREANETAMKAGMLNKITYPTGGYSLFNWEAHKSQISETTQVPVTNSASAYGNNNLNSPHPSQTITFTVNGLQGGQAALRIMTSTFNKANAPLYSDPAMRDKAEEDPWVRLKNLTTGEVQYYTHFINNVTTQDFTTNVLLTNGNTYELIAECYVNLDYASVAISVTYNTTDNTPKIITTGGLRISSIDNFTAAGLRASKDIYKYGDNESGNGRLSTVSSGFYVYDSDRTYEFDNAKLGHPQCGVCSMTKKNYSATSIYGLSPASGSSVVYGTITKYHVDESNNTNTGKTIYYYSDKSDVNQFAMPSGAEMRFYLIPDNWTSGVLEKIEEYKKTPSGYDLLKRTTNKYLQYSVPDNVFMKVGYVKDKSNATTFNYSDFYIKQLYITTGTYKLDSVITEDRSGVKPIITVKKTFYDDVYHYFAASENMTDSKSGTIMNVFKYVFNKNQITGLNGTASAAIDKMAEQNNVSGLIEQQYYRNNSLKQTIRINYKIFSEISNDLVKRNSVQSKFATSSFEDRVFFNEYDNKGNLKNQSLAAGPQIIYLWGYNGLYPVAEIKNATYQSVVNVIGQTAIDQLASSSPGTDAFVRNSLNTLRSQLPGSQVISYTYSPLVGMTSITDAKGETTYYEYDSFQRLVNVKDKDGNIIKHTDYHYQTQ